MSEMNQAGMDIFYQECLDLFEEIEESLLNLEQNPQDQSTISTLFRNFHTIKGGASMFGLIELSQFTHEIESLLSMARSGEVIISGNLVSIFLEALDCIKIYIDQIQSEKIPNDTQFKKITADIKSFNQSQANSLSESISLETEAAADIKAKIINHFLIKIVFSSDFLKNGLDPITFFQEIRQMGHVIIIPHAHGIPSLETIDPFQLYIHWSIKLETEQSLEDLNKLLMFYQFDHEIAIEQIKTPPEETIAKARINRGEVLTEMSLPPGPVLEKTAVVSEFETENSAPTPSIKTNPTIRVAIGKLDRLVNLVGEALINQTRLNKITELISGVDEQLSETAMQLVDDNELIVRELQEQVLNIRMVPIQGSLTPFQRLIRTYCVSSGKKIKLEISGGETELDKTLTEKLSGPLKHLIRNALDHGIESPEHRKAAGKDLTGLIVINAYQQEGHIIIEIKDDGDGIDTQKVLKIAQEKGLVKKGELFSDQEIYQLLFKAGFSTSEEVSDISGRGVGMDVVKRDIESLHGTIYIESQPGRGALFRIRLPLTLAIIEGMLIEVGSEIFTIPILSVVESLKPYPNQIKTVKNRKEMILFRDEYIPLIRLKSVFKLKPNDESDLDGMIIVIENMGKFYGFFADNVLEQQQIVIKSLEENFVQLPGIAGATILGNGSVSLIIDVPGIIKLEHLSDKTQSKVMDDERHISNA